MMWTVRVLWSVGVSMVHAMQDRIGSRRKVRTTLPNPGKEVEEFFPEFAHHKHLMSGIAVKEEALAKQGEIPMQKKEDNDNHSGNS